MSLVGIKEAGRLVGRSWNVIGRLAERGDLTPRMTVQQGTKTRRLFDADDVRRAVLGPRRPRRKRNVTREIVYRALYPWTPHEIWAMGPEAVAAWLRAG